MSAHQWPQTEASTESSRTASRLVGVDIARALAIFGMFTVHLGVGAIGLLNLDVVVEQFPRLTGGGAPLGQESAAELFHQLTRGRSSALFAFLAGLSLALISGRSVPYRGGQLGRVALRVVVRAGLLIILGGVVELLDTPIAIILVYYGLFFLLALPLLSLRAPALAAVAAAVAILGPQMSYLIRDGLRLDETDSAPASIWPGLSDLLLIGYYPAFTFMAFVIAGMAVGRLDLRSNSVRAGLAGTGAGLALLGYGGSWFALNMLGGLNLLVASTLAQSYGPDNQEQVRQNLAESAANSADSDAYRQWMLEEANSLHGQVPTDSAAWLLVATPHSGTSFEIFGAVGTGLLVLVACLVLGDRAARLLYPVAAAGAMALTVYVGHLFFIALLDASPWEPAPFRLEYFVLGALVFATLWRLVFGRGLLERAISAVADATERTVLPQGPLHR